jgi:hypothetical protein
MLARVIAHAAALSASIDTVFSTEQRAAKPQNLADCHRFAATRLKFAARLRVFTRHCAMCVKLFNRRRFLTRSDRGALVLPQAVPLHLAKKALVSERLFVSHVVPFASTRSPP